MLNKLLLLLLITTIFMSCKWVKRYGIPFGDVKGTHFKEVRRVFNNGMTFDKRGYQLEPSWNLYFISDDSVNVYSPKMKRYYGFHVYFDHDSIFNMVDVWFKIRKLAPDSMVLQSLRVVDKIIQDDDEGSKVYLTFYSDKYIAAHDSSKIARMGLPGKKDTAFIKKKCELANTHIDSAFAARNPAMLKSKSPLIVVEKVKAVSTPLEKIDASEEYLSPEYNITIHKAYEGFNYSMYVYVDDKGKMTLRNSAIPYSHEFKETYEKVLRGIIDGYFARYLEITPGNTLGIAHASCILVNVEGKVE